MSEEEQKAMENDILFQIDMELYDKFNDKFCKMNEYLGEIYSYADIKDLEDSRNATEINLLRQAIVKQQKEIAELKDFINNTSFTIPFDRTNIKENEPLADIVIAVEKKYISEDKIKEIIEDLNEKIKNATEIEAIFMIKQQQILQKVLEE